MRKKRALLAEDHFTDVSMDKFCCKTLKFFDSTDASYLQLKRVQLLNMSQKDRRVTLIAMLKFDGNFCFDGQIICTQFLSAVFRLSFNFQRSVRVGLSRVKLGSDRSSNGGVSTSFPSKDIVPSGKECAAVSCLHRLA